MLGIIDLAAPNPRLLIELLHQAVTGVFVSDAGGVAEQILDGDRPLHRYKIEAAVVFDADFLVGKFRDEFGDGIIEQEVTFLEQHHDADRNDRLGHGKDAEDRVPRHRGACARVLLAKRVEPADLAASGDHDGRTGHGSFVDLALEHIGHPLQA
jgi:hypothetical protein